MDDVRRRSCFRGVVTGATAMVGVAAAGLSGVFAGQAAHDTALSDAAEQQAEQVAAQQQARQAARQHRRELAAWRRDNAEAAAQQPRERPRRTIVRTKVVYRQVPATLGGGSVAVAADSSGPVTGSTGGVVVTSGSSGSGSSGSGSGSSGPGAGGSHSAPPPPPPPPPPAPSSGS